MTSSTFRVISPIDGSEYLSRSYAGPEEITEKLAKAKVAMAAWRRRPPVAHSGGSKADGSCD